MNPLKDFVSSEKHDYHICMGKHIASSLSGFIAGAVVSSIIWGVGVYLHSFTH
jgi:hypothetical protein